MKDQKSTKYIIGCVLGATLVITGILLAIFFAIPQGVMQALPFVLIGLGLGAFGGGLGGVLSVRMIKKDPKFAKQLNDFYDERAIMLETKAKAKTNDFTATMLCALIIFLAVMQVQLLVILVFIGAMLVRMFVLHYLMKKYLKEM